MDRRTDPLRRKPPVLLSEVDEDEGVESSVIWPLLQNEESEGQVFSDVMESLLVVLSLAISASSLFLVFGDDYEFQAIKKDFLKATSWHARGEAAVDNPSIYRAVNRGDNR